MVHRYLGRSQQIKQLSQSISSQRVRSLKRIHPRKTRLMAKDWTGCRLSSSKHRIIVEHQALQKNLLTKEREGCLSIPQQQGSFHMAFAYGQSEETLQNPHMGFQQLPSKAAAYLQKDVCRSTGVGQERKLVCQFSGLMWRLGVQAQVFLSINSESECLCYSMPRGVAGDTVVFEEVTGASTASGAHTVRKVAPHPWLRYDRGIPPGLTLGSWC